jgi:putative ABC transport system ATP-binding protein
MYELIDVTKRFRQGSREVMAVDGVELTVEEGEFLAIEGASGSGKTTLLQLLGGLDRPSSGTVRFEGKDLAKMGEGDLARLRGRAFGFVFQAFNLIPTLTALENVEAALVPLRVRGRERRRLARQALDDVGLGERARHLPSELSGGEQQRVAIARALVKQPRVILADEPTGNLDARTREEVVDLLHELWQVRGQTLVLVTHEESVASRSSRRAWMLDGRLGYRLAPSGDRAGLGVDQARV